MKIKYYQIKKIQRYKINLMINLKQNYRIKNNNLKKYKIIKINMG